MLEMEAMAVLNFSTASSSSSNSTKEGLAGIFGGRCIPSDLGIPVTTSNITPQPVLTSCRKVNAQVTHTHTHVQEMLDEVMTGTYFSDKAEAYCLFKTVPYDSPSVEMVTYMYTLEVHCVSQKQWLQLYKPVMHPSSLCPLSAYFLH